MASAKLGTKAVGSIVKLNVNGAAKEFIVVHQGKPSSLYDESCDGTWLLMKDIFEATRWHSSDVNNLENSTIHSILNSTLLNAFESNIRDAIKQVKIPYRKNGGSSGSDQSGANGLLCKIFLLSGYEIGFTTSDNPYFPQDGAKLSYFESGTDTSANNKRIAKLNGSADYWGLRSPFTYSTSLVWLVNYDGVGETSKASNSTGIRPALILPPDMEVDSSGNVTPPPPATHKTLVNGTAYEIKGGKCLVNGTVYNILKGRTLIGGTGYDINFEPDVSLTWYFNQTLSIPVSTTSTTFSTRAHYEGGSKTITGIQIINRGDNPNMSYLGSGFASTAWDQRRGWRDTAYRTITFDEAPSGDLLAWLQENATPQ
jgi:hypothetical protein|nr:MAG TPA: hypothetical protein [Caudoviricetes sp.]